MRRFLLSLLVVACVPTLASCGDDTQPMFMILNYQVSCRNVGGCSGIPARQIETLNGELGHSISCTVTRTGDQVLFSMSVDHSSSDPLEDYAFAIRNAVTSSAGGPASSAQITVREGMSTYMGTAGGSPPSDTCSGDPPTGCPTPCRLFDISFETTANGPAILGSIQCEGLPLTADSMVAREVHFPTAADMPADFLVENCEGLGDE